ncbi:hypothetical protein THAOC_17214 [Thalassiosira oceanica]|uniref:SET domain-containing protein n=1 Tax=Thalassiosira oceanica TaxID=159749 RepID=K0S7Z7_THAOC|nr:hypothetical protein THAOC_17214 [Thalassiosira oceanica]|eukprot:EJK62183.1 hypothetical protein THAOC_17214 [Thalassiosira oceanica]
MRRRSSLVSIARSGMMLQLVGAAMLSIPVRCRRDRDRRRESHGESGAATVTKHYNLDHLIQGDGRDKIETAWRKMAMSMAAAAGRRQSGLSGQFLSATMSRRTALSCFLLPISLLLSSTIPNFWLWRKTTVRRAAAPVEADAVAADDAPRIRNARGTPNDGIGEGSRSRSRASLRGRRGPTLRQLERQRKCNARDGDERPLYTDEDWERLRRLYREAGVGATVEFPEGASAAPPGFVPPMVAGQTADGKGRGVFATRDIAKGEMTYGGMDNYAYFSTGEAYRTFIGALSDAEACDVMMWSWTQNNAPRNGRKGQQVANTGCPDPAGKKCSWFDEYALIDIREGDEFLCDYAEFAELDLWEEFGL